MNLFGLEAWPLWCGFGLMIIAAAMNGRRLTVPNWLSFGSAITGLLVAIFVTIQGGGPTRGAGIQSSLAGAGVALVLLVPLYGAARLGAGCVKMQAAFGVWVGCVLPPASAAVLVGLGTLTGAILLAVALGITLIIDSRPPNGDIRSQLFPAQIHLTFGTIFGAVAAVLAGWV